MNEGAYAHFEAQIQPVSDPYMRIEWYKDGRSITASSRITTIYNFGYKLQRDGQIIFFQI
jgi:titin